MGPHLQLHSAPHTVDAAGSPCHPNGTATGPQQGHRWYFGPRSPVENPAGWPRAATGSALQEIRHVPQRSIDLSTRYPTGRFSHRRNPAMTAAGRLAELASDQSEWGGPELLPVRLARACKTVLPVAGAGLSMYSSNDFRVPIGASDDMAAEAERLQFTLGEGPCLVAHAEGRFVSASEADLERLWPRFHEELVARTTYRSIISLPLEQALHGVAALDLYLDESTAQLAVDHADLIAVADTLTAQLLDEPDRADAVRGGGPAWLDSPATRRRSTVWGAIGMINVGLHLSTVDALAVLRGYSYAHASSLDDIADRLVTRDLPVDALFQDS